MPLRSLRMRFSGGRGKIAFTMPLRALLKPALATLGRIVLPAGEGLLFVLGYVVLDWASYLHPLHGLNITPWNPSPALGLVFRLRHGIGAALPWFLAILLGEVLVRGLPATLPYTVFLAAALTLGYGAMGSLMRHRLRHARLPRDRQGLLVWASIVVAGTLVTSGLFVSLLWSGELIPRGEGILAWVRAWIGDCVGIIATMPFFWLLMDRAGRGELTSLLTRLESVGQGLLALAMLWVAFGLGGTGEFQYFYLLFLPIVWAAARQGMAGAAVAAFVLQAGVIVAVNWQNIVAVTVFELQMLGAALAFVGLFIGAVVDEKERVSRELRHSLRLAAAGEMAAALAHELNQPLTALSAYGAASRQLLERGETGPALADTIGRMLSESRRAAEVVRRLRDFFRTGATRLENVLLPDLVDRAVAHYRDKVFRNGVELKLEALPVCRLWVDAAQMEVVLRNLLANALDAVAERPGGERSIRIRGVVEASMLVLVVEDSGSGLGEADIEHLFEPFHSTKSSGLGLGLAISRAIAQAHGGDLSAEPGPRGLFQLTLPVEG